MDTLFGETSLLIVRWVHFLAGIVWIGHLYYFNFVQAPFFAEIDANTKNIAISKLVPRALWWFRWGAKVTFLAGLYLLLSKGHAAGGPEVYYSSWGLTILVGSLLGTLMYLNVWCVIWPNQKVVIASANQVIGGGQALPNAAACGAKALLASRTNTMFSIPMLLFMGMASHASFNLQAESWTLLWAAVFVIIGALEANALFGKIGYMSTVKGVISCGFALAAVLYGVLCYLA